MVLKKTTRGEEHKHNSSLFHFFFKANAVFYSGILPVVGNKFVPVFFVKFNGFGLPLARFQYTFFIGQFSGSFF